MKSRYFFILLLFPFQFFGQSGTNNIVGRVYDENHQPLEFINIILYNATDSSLEKATASTALGAFAFDQIKNGEYFIKSSFIGYQDNSIPLPELKGNKEIVLNDLILALADNETKAVQVVFKKPLVQVEADKTIFNVEGTINSAGLNALELLRKAPGVMLDNNDNISIKGRSGIMVYIDGKPTPLDGDGLKAMLKNMQSSNIESIEIITNPSSKYDAAGTAGIINIKLKKNRNYGTNGSVQVGYGVQLYSKYNASITLNHRNEKWNLFGTYGINQGKSWSWMDFDRNQLNPIDSLKYLYSQTTNNVSENLAHNYKAGIDYYINDHNTIGVMVNGNIAENDQRGSSFTNISVLGEQVTKTLEAQTNAISNRSNINGNINYHYSDSTGKDLMMDADYGYYDIASNTFQPNSYTYPNQAISPDNINYRFITPVRISIASFKVDYEQKILSGVFGAGFKSSNVQTENTLNRFNIYESGETIDSLLSNSFKYDENINAAYVNYKKTLKKMSFQLGVRAEQTTSKGKLQSFTSLSDESARNVNRSYLNFFPSGGLTYSINDTNQFALTLSRRIDRPSYQDLNPFESKLDELTYERGNPFLQPQYGHIAELSYTYRYSLNASLTYSYTDDFFTNITDTANNSASYIMNRNLGFEEWIGLSISSPIPLSEKINAFVNINSGRKRIKADFSDIDLTIWNYSFFAQATYSLPKSTTLEVSGWYSGPNVWGATFVTRPMGSMDIAVKKEIMNGKGSFRFALSDIFYSNVWRSSSTVPQLQITGTGGWESRQFRVSFTYNFGNQEMKNKQRKSGADDLKERVK